MKFDFITLIVFLSFLVIGGISFGVHTYLQAKKSAKELDDTITKYRLRYHEDYYE